MFRAVALISSLLAVVSAQQVGTNTAETHPKLSWSKCAAGGACTAQSTGAITIDANWRFLHQTSSLTNCFSGNTWDTTICTDGKTCAANCALDGADYTATYGITTSSTSLTLKFVTNGQFATNIGSRVYLMNSDSKYEMFKLKNQEFTFDVDMSQLPCGLNGAVYFVAMDQDGGVAKFPTNKAGAKYGTGYCDAQCPHDIKFINGIANSEGWQPSPTDKNAGKGPNGSCCTEMDIWEANVNGAAYTPHPCSVDGQTMCTSGTQCGDGTDRQNGVCDKDGCDFNSFRMGDQSFMGKGLTVDTTKKFTIVTQFITDTNTTAGTLTEIRRFYVQGGKTFQNSVTKIDGMDALNSVSDKFCAQQKTAFGDPNTFAKLGGLKRMGDVMDKGMVLVLSLWDDHDVNMLWLDSTFPTDKTGPGTQRGLCSITSGAPTDVESQSPNASVIYSNIKFGPIGSTFANK